MRLRISFVLFLGLSCQAQNTVRPDTNRMDQVVQAYVANKTFMGSVLVARGGDVLISKSYGAANLEWNIPNTPATKFRLGSVTKQFTAASILLLEERGKLKVEDPVAKHLPDAPAAWEKITIFHLLTHTSGIPNFTSFPEYRTWQAFATPAEKLVGFFRDKPLEFAPGERMNYSNSGYVLLGYLIEKISGQSYEAFLQQNIFTPLEMKDSGYDSNSALLGRRAAGYSPSPRGVENAGFVHMSIPHGAGALYSTTEDLLRWQQGLYGGKLLSAASLEKMTTPFKNNYAFGVTVNTAGGRKVISHAGGIEGFNTYLAYYPGDKTTVAVLANLNGNAPQEIAGRLGSVAHGETVVLPSERKEITLSRDALSKYVGSYEIAPTANMTISLDGSQLRGQIAGQPALPLFAESETSFFLKAVDAQIEFVRDPQGAVTHLVLHQGGRDQKAMRLPERTEITVAPAILAMYAGTYQLRAGFNLVITVENGQLMSQATGQGKAALFAESETKFFLKTANAQIEFVKNAAGAVTDLILHQGGRDTKAARQ
jgi:CubicO group peptidase (beta-lactamase class C family)